MQINISTDYALRAVLYLSTVDRPADSVELAEVLAIPQRYLLNICAKLRKAGLLLSSPGHGGGLRLARPAGEITMLDVITVMENSIRMNRCLEEDHFCSRNAVDFCPLNTAYRKAQRSMEEVFSITFAELAAQNKR